MAFFHHQAPGSGRKTGSELFSGPCGAAPGSKRQVNLQYQRDPAARWQDLGQRQVRIFNTIQYTK